MLVACRLAGLSALEAYYARRDEALGLLTQWKAKAAKVAE